MSLRGHRPFVVPLMSLRGHPSSRLIPLAKSTPGHIGNPRREIPIPYSLLPTIQARTGRMGILLGTPADPPSLPPLGYPPPFSSKCFSALQCGAGSTPRRLQSSRIGFRLWALGRSMQAEVDVSTSTYQQSHQYPTIISWQ